MLTIAEALGIAVEHHQAGRLQAAEQVYRQILAADPNQPDAWHLLGVAIAQSGNLQPGVECIRRAIALRPDFPEAHYNLGTALDDQGKPDEAIACYRRAVELKPDHAEAHYSLGVALERQRKTHDAAASYRRTVELRPHHAEAHNNLGNALMDLGKLDEAVASYRRALELKPDRAEVYYNLGNALRDQGNLDETVACYRRALELKPDYAEAHNNLGIVLGKQGDLEQAVACCRRAVELRPDNAEAYFNLANALKDRGRPHEAVACYCRALELKADFAQACNNLGIAWKALGRLDEAVASYRRALELKADFAQAHSNLGSVLQDQGKHDEAVACYRRAVELKPHDAEARSNLVYALGFVSGCDARTICQARREWDEHCAAPLANLIQPHGNDRSAGRRLRIGYVSPDFRGHPVGRFMLPLLASHDHRQFEIFCYASVHLPDAITDRCRAQADVWREVRRLSDEEVAEAVRADQIDILVDLTMHMANNRLLVFARKPAPVQVTYLAYCGTTGLRTMDYRLTDPYLDPPGQDEQFYSEQSVYLSETYWCYQPVEETPPVGPLPVLQAGRITFGCLNNFCKVTSPTVAAWTRLLQAVPESRLFLHAYAGSHRGQLLDSLTGHDISPDRVTFSGMVPTADYLRLYGQIDVALDPFPYGGGTTTCDALWMGAPVVSVAGRTAMGRAGLSILSNVGLPELVARDEKQYVRIAGELAADLPRLSELRATLRDRMRRSPLMDAPRFARNIEAAYRTMWQRWCARQVRPAEP